MATEKKSLGLKALRSGRDSKGPQHQCDNCRCRRYSPCTCQRKKAKANNDGTN